MSEEMSESVRSPIWELFAKQAAFIAALLMLFFSHWPRILIALKMRVGFILVVVVLSKILWGPLALSLRIWCRVLGSLFYSLPPLFFWVAIILWRNPHSLLPLNNALLCTIGSIMYLSFGSVLCFLHTVGEYSLQYGSGGILGRGLGTLLYGFIGYDGATLVSLALVVLSFTLLAQLHWLHLMDRLGESAYKFVMFVRHKWADRQEAKSTQRAEMADLFVDEVEAEEPAIVRKRRKAATEPSKNTVPSDGHAKTDPLFEDVRIDREHYDDGGQTKNSSFVCLRCFRVQKPPIQKTPQVMW